LGLLALSHRRLSPQRREEQRHSVPISPLLAEAGAEPLTLLPHSQDHLVEVVPVLIIGFLRKVARRARRVKALRVVTAWAMRPITAVQGVAAAVPVPLAPPELEAPASVALVAREFLSSP
jgi:hypothetical protein